MKRCQPKFRQRLSKERSVSVERPGHWTQRGRAEESPVQADRGTQAMVLLPAKIGAAVVKAERLPNNALERTGNERGRVRGTRESVCLAAESKRLPAAQLGRYTSLSANKCAWSCSAAAFGSSP